MVVFPNQINQAFIPPTGASDRFMAIHLLAVAITPTFCFFLNSIVKKFHENYRLRK
jgi:hypothetical protein